MYAMLGSPTTSLLAKPKSQILRTLVSRLIRMFWGFMSLWHIPMASWDKSQYPAGRAAHEAFDSCKALVIWMGLFASACVSNVSSLKVSLVRIPLQD